jgi:serine-protein kinase ATM
MLTLDSFQHISSITSCRETLLSSLSKNKNLQAVLKTSQRDSRSLEITALLASSKMSRHHGALQNSLATATYLNRLIEPCEEVGLNIAAAVQFESANVLWDQGELTASIRILQDLQNRSDAESQLIHVGKPELLAKLVEKTCFAP